MGNICNGEESPDEEEEESLKWWLDVLPEYPTDVPRLLEECYCPDCHERFVTRSDLQNHSCPEHLPPFYGASPREPILHALAPAQSVETIATTRVIVALGNDNTRQESGLLCPSCNHRTLVEGIVRIQDDEVLIRRCLRCSFRERI